MSTTLIRNGHVIDPATGIDAPRDLLLRNGLVAPLMVFGMNQDNRTAKEGVATADRAVCVLTRVRTHKVIGASKAL